MNQAWPVKKPALEWCSKPKKDGTPGGCLTQRSDAKTKMAPADFNRSLFADDAAFIFLSRDDIAIGTKHITEHFCKFGLEVHLGTKREDGTTIKAKTEFMHVPIKGQESSLTDTADLEILADRFVSHCTQFRYLGSEITGDLDDSTDIAARIGKGYAAMRLLEPVLLNKKINVEIRAQFYQALVLNTVLWGCDSMAAGQKHFQDLEVFQNHCIRRMNFMNLSHCQYYGVKMETMRDRVKLPTLRSIFQLRQLHWLEKVARMPPTRLTRQVISCQAVRPPDHKFQKGSTLTTQASYRHVLEEAGLCEKSKGGAFGSWMPKIQGGDDVCRMIDENLGLPTGTYKSGRRLKPNKRTRTFEKPTRSV